MHLLVSPRVGKIDAEGNNHFTDAKKNQNRLAHHAGLLLLLGCTWI